MPRRFSLPPGLRSALQDGTHEEGVRAARPAEPRTAATVMLVREPAIAGTGVEVWLLQRDGGAAGSGGSGPAPGAVVFPGGGLDARDADADVPWRGAPVPGWGRHLGLPDEEAAALLCAAVRETYEECGVLLAEVDDTVPETPEGSGGPEDGRPRTVLPVREGDEDAERAALGSHALALAEVLRARGLALRSDLLRPWGRWVTPEAEPRRHDTWFFLAALPAGSRVRSQGGVDQSGADQGGADQGGADQGGADQGGADRRGAGGRLAGRWWRPADVLDAEAVGQVALLTATRVAVEELAAAPDLASLLGTRRSLEPVLPWVSGDPGEEHLLADLPEHPDPVGLV